MFLSKAKVSSCTSLVFGNFQRGPGFTASVNCSVYSTCAIWLMKGGGGLWAFIGGVAFDVSSEVWSRKDINRSLREFLSEHSRAKAVTDWEGWLLWKSRCVRPL